MAGVTRKSIQIDDPIISCDVCGRTLLVGEHAAVFLHGGARRMVCELCTARAAHEGWIREGLDASSVRARGEGRRGGLLARLRARRADLVARAAGALAPGGGSAPHAREPDDGAAPRSEPQPQSQSQSPDDESRAATAPEPPAAAAPGPERAAAPSSPGGGGRAVNGTGREHRSVHAIPTNADLKLARALELFNASPHRRTVSGVARSLGAPLVIVRQSPSEGSVVIIAVAWELSWYRYEVDLADEAAGVRVAGQGAELDELDPAEHVPNAAADETGALRLVAEHAR